MSPSTRSRGRDSCRPRWCRRGVRRAGGAASRRRGHGMPAGLRRRRRWRSRTSRRGRRDGTVRRRRRGRSHG
ncbi:hypothetical protein D3C59_36230 [Streptomyces sp. SHP22-7]|nr:hypothetical protein D3C59_36230 [Streptomyces sp. SHP22-7]